MHLICNITSDNVNPTGFHDFFVVAKRVFPDVPYNEIFPRPGFKITSNRFVRFFPLCKISEIFFCTLFYIVFI